MAVAEVTVVPLGTGSPSLSAYVAKVLKVLEKSGLTYQLTPMGTIIQGDPREIMNVVLEMHNTLFSKEIQRVVTTLKIDDRRDKSLSMESKVKAVKEKMD
jgi:uncharacterized protein (TIGR00106 family)